MQSFLDPSWRQFFGAFPSGLTMRGCTQTLITRQLVRSSPSGKMSLSLLMDIIFISVDQKENLEQDDEKDMCHRTVIETLSIWVIFKLLFLISNCMQGSSTSNARPQKNAKDLLLNSGLDHPKKIFRSMGLYSEKIQMLHQQVIYYHCNHA